MARKTIEAEVRLKSGGLSLVLEELAEFRRQLEQLGQERATTQWVRELEGRVDAVKAQAGRAEHLAKNSALRSVVELEGRVRKLDEADIVGREMRGRLLERVEAVEGRVEKPATAEFILEAERRLTALEGERLLAAGVRIGEIPIDTAARLKVLEAARQLHDGGLADRISELEGWRELAGKDWLVGVERRERDRDRVVPRLEAIEGDAEDARLALEVARGVSTELGVFKPEIAGRLEPLERLFTARPDLQAELEGRISKLEADAGKRGRPGAVGEIFERLAPLERLQAQVEDLKIPTDFGGRIRRVEHELHGVEDRPRGLVERVSELQDRLGVWSEEVSGLWVKLEHFESDLEIQAATTDRLSSEASARDLGGGDAIAALGAAEGSIRASRGPRDRLGRVDSGSRLPVVDLTTGTAQIIIARDGRPSEVVQVVDGKAPVVPLAVAEHRAQKAAEASERAEKIQRGIDALESGEEVKIQEPPRAERIKGELPVVDLGISGTAQVIIAREGRPSEVVQIVDGKAPVEKIKAGEEDGVTFRPLKDFLEGPADPRVTLAQAAENAARAGRAGVRLGPGPEDDDPGGIERTKKLARVDEDPALVEEIKKDFAPIRRAWEESKAHGILSKAEQTAGQKAAAAGADLAAEWRKKEDRLAQIKTEKGFPSPPEQGPPERIGPGKYVAEKAGPRDVDTTDLPDPEAPLGVQLRGIALELDRRERVSGNLVELSDRWVRQLVIRLGMLAAVGDGLAGLARKAVPSIAGREVPVGKTFSTSTAPAAKSAEIEVVASYLEQVGANLEAGARRGTLPDEPEGSRWLQISDTLAKQITTNLREKASSLRALADVVRTYI